MIKVRLITTANQDIVNVSEDAYVREILEDNNITVLNNAITMLEGCNLRPGDLDKTLPELGVTSDSCVLSVVVKTANAAKAEVTGPICVVKSDLTLEQWKDITKYYPEEATLYQYDESDKANAVFNIAITERSTGMMNCHGVTFGTDTDREGHALAIFKFDGSTEALKDKIGVGLLRLNELENDLQHTLKDIEEDKKNLDKMIEIK